MVDHEFTIGVEVNNLEEVKQLRKELERIKELKKEIKELEKDDEEDTNPLDIPDPKPNPRPRPKFPDDVWMNVDEDGFEADDKILADTQFEI